MDRSGFIGGSDVAAILGVSPWTTPYALWEEKVYGIADETNSERERAFRWGKRMEPAVIEMLQEEYDVHVLARNQVYHDKEYDFLRCEIDFEYVLPGAVLQEGGSFPFGNGDVKTAWSSKAWGDVGSDQIPTYYVAQFQHGMGITGAPICMCAALLGAGDLRPYYIERDDDLIQIVRQKSVAFWNDHVLTRIPPPLTNGNDARKLLSRFDGVALLATDEQRTALRQLIGVKAAVKRLESKREALEDSIKIALAMAAAEHQEVGKAALVDSGGKTVCTWHEQTTRRVSMEKLKELHQDVATECTEESTIRVMRVQERNL